MEIFRAGDKVVAVNVNMGRPINPAEDSVLADYYFPDGVLRRHVVYHVAAVKELSSGQGVFITGLRAYWLDSEIPWASCRFRKVDALKGHVPVKEEQPMHLHLVRC